MAQQWQHIWIWISTRIPSPPDPPRKSSKWETYLRLIKSTVPITGASDGCLWGWVDASVRCLRWVDLRGWDVYLVTLCVFNGFRVNQITNQWISQLISQYVFCLLLVLFKYIEQGKCNMDSVEHTKNRNSITINNRRQHSPHRTEITAWDTLHIYTTDM